MGLSQVKAFAILPRTGRRAAINTPADIDLSVLTATNSRAAHYILEIVKAQTGMGLVGMAWVRSNMWRACAVVDDMGLGMKAGDELDVDSTLCKDVMESQLGIAFDDALDHPVFHDHKTPKLYGFRAYISEPILLTDGSYFGNLFALDAEPRPITSEKNRAIFTACAGILGKLLQDQLISQQLSNEIQSFKETGNAREVFLAVVAHDLRNPLQAITMGAKMLARGDEPKAAKLGERIATSARRMSKLIDDLVDYAKGRAGNAISVAPEPTQNLAAALHTVIDEFVEAHPQHAFVASLELPAEVRVDIPRIQQLLSNLLGNAVAYGGSDFPIQITGSLEGKDIVILVNNRGPLVPDEVMAQMFDPHFQGPKSAATSMGLGLSICKQIVAAHQGSLTVLSCSDAGTTFTIRLPVVL